MASWVDAARAIALDRVGVELGLSRYGAHWGPCPGCGETARSKGDRRKGPVYPTERGWACSRCDARGDAVDLVSYRLTGGKLTRASTSVVREWYAARGWCGAARGSEVVAVTPRPALPPEEPREPAPVEEVAELWGRCTALDADTPGRRWLVSRGIDPDVVVARDLARELPETGELPRWAEHWRTTHPAPVILPLHYPGRGIVGLQGRRVDGGTPKSVAARGVARIGVYRSRGGPPGRVLVVEGEPDYLTWATRPSHGWIPTIGLPGAGAWCAEIAAAVTDGVDVLVRCHLDEQGRRYTRAIRDSLAGRCRVWVPA